MTTPHRFVWRTFTSVFLGALFLMAVLTGTILFLAPPGRIANWTNWAIGGLTKQQWIALHITFTVVFLVVAIFHLIFNWRPLVNYFKDRLTRRFGFRWEWVTALVVTVLMAWGTLAGTAPFSWLMAFNEDLKQLWDEPQQRAPIPHAELLSLSELAAKATVNWEMATGRLDRAGITGVSSEIIVEELARANHVPARRIYELITSQPGGSGRGRQGGGQGRAGGGVGWKTLAQYCTDEGIAVEAAIQRLDTKGFKASKEQTLREIAVNNGLQRPSELLQVLRETPGTNR
jgi:hypothetical protein